MRGFTVPFLGHPRYPATAGAWLAALLLACSGDPTSPNAGPTPPTTPPALPPSLAVVSAAPSPPPAGVASFVNGNGPVAWVSMPPGTDTAAAGVVVVNVKGGPTVEVFAADGGFDPVAIPAAAGDTLRVTVRHRSGATVTGYARVPLESRPIIVRTSPPNRKTDVPLNAVILVVFSEPMDSASLSSGVTLRWSGGAVAGTVRLVAVQGSAGLGAALTPAVNLLPGTTYTMQVDTTATSELGAPLDSASVLTFITDTATSDTMPPPIDTLPPPPAAGDTSAPVVSILSPLQGDTVPRRLLSILVRVDDDQGMGGLSFSALGTPAPWGTWEAWDATPTDLIGRSRAQIIVPDPAGSTYTLQVTATDAAGNVGTSAPVVVTAVDPDTTPRIIVRSFEVIEFQDPNSPSLPWNYVPRLTVAEQPGGNGLEIVSIETIPPTPVGGPIWARFLTVLPGADKPLFQDLYGDYEIVVGSATRVTDPWRMRLTYRDATTHHYYATIIEGAIVPGPSSPGNYSGGCGHWSGPGIIPESIFPYMFTDPCAT
jgi:hypothetical protein